MKKITLAISLLTWLGATVCSLAQTPQLLLHAAQCLEAKGFLPSSEATKLTLGYFLDEKSYPGDRAIYLVQYAAPARSNGFVFVVFLTEHDGHQAFDIQNNAGFVLSREEPLGISFISPPLGGAWTQAHIASAIKVIEKKPRFTVSVRNLLAADSSFACRSYTDPQREPGEK